MFTNETSIIPSTLRNNPVYVSIYLTWMKIIIIEAIPYISILTLNICILKKVYNASKYRQSFRQSHYIEVVQGTIFIEQNWYFVTKICSDLLWEKIVLVIKKKFSNTRLKAENLQNFWGHLNNLFKLRTIFGNRIFFNLV